ncbi:unnamed protein product [Rotaria sp. Silwood2]|nr:unnamed protein product [Rotaria sp. Silwood2]CAF3522095.1 unnamed protein product [Rotaria sp. Silwood2]CAF4045992.1 unnamed protein product [Rotaria sp. Silwood2]CAF4756070.1 unnamed protein product [Rotaria sp. Silwood2]
MNLINGLVTLYYTILLYLSAFFSLETPGTVIWKLFKNRKGKISLISRDLICDSETLINLPKCAKPLDGFTNALCPFIPTFLIDNNDRYWKQRRIVFSHADPIIDERILEKSFHFKLENKKGNILWDIFEIMSKISFELMFNRIPTENEFNDIYPGLLDINKVIKRFTSTPDMQIRQKFYDRTLLLIQQNETNFVFNNCKDFYDMNELHQVSSVAEDFLTTISVQCTDLVCHMLLLYSQYPNDFHNDIENSINETLRLYPLTDIWARQPYRKHRGWIASLVQLNRNGWTQPDSFLPQRWNIENHPQLMSWGFDIRRCPAKKIATNISKLVFENIIKTEGFWIKPAKNFEHERTFPYGCQVWIGYGQIPNEVNSWKFNRKFQMQCRRWLCERLRMIDQNELN